MGAPVYRNLSQAELDRQYDQRTIVPDAPSHIARWQDWSAQTRALRPPKRIAYGDHKDEAMDLFEGDPDGPVHAFVHGGAWRTTTASDVSFVVDGLGHDGATVAVLDFSAAPDAGIAQMADQVRRAFLALTGLTNGPVTLTAHSSGAHLASLLLKKSWQSKQHAKRPAGLVLISGPYDLEPVQLSARNTYLRLSAAEARALSLVNDLPCSTPPVALFWGEGDHAEFQRQSMALGDVLRTRGPMQATPLQRLNHFEVCATLRDPDAAPTRAARAHMTNAPRNPS